ncbi:MAG TPA: helix-turn-helix domain-containing protein [Vicinamibacteria bacterium]
MLDTVPLRRTAGVTGGDAAVLERDHPAPRAGDDDPVALALALLGGPWRPLVAWQLFWGPRRFGELVRHTGGIGPKQLRRTLAGLERDGLVRKRLRPRAIRPTEYALTPLGESARPLLATLYEWGLGLRGQVAPSPRTPPSPPPLEGPWRRADSPDKEMS